MSRDNALVEAMDHIKEYMRERDLGGCISLSSKTHGEIGMQIPSWAALRMEVIDGKQYVQTFAGKDAELQSLTASFIFSQADVLSNYAVFFLDTAQAIREKAEAAGGSVEHVPFEGFESRN